MSTLTLLGCAMLTKCVLEAKTYGCMDGWMDDSRFGATHQQDAFGAWRSLLQGACVLSEAELLCSFSWSACLVGFL